MILVDGIAKAFGERTVLDGVSLRVNPGAVTAVIGGSGSGKTTLSRCIVGLEAVNGGAVDVDGTRLDASALPWSDIAIEARQKVGMVFQDLRLWPYRTALDNILEGLIYVKGLSRDRAMPLVDEWSALLGIGRLLGKYPPSLSGGEKQRVAIARAVVMNPGYLVLDEITSALDPEVAGDVSDLLLELKNKGIGMLLISHQIEWVRRFADSVHFLLHGRVAECGSAADVLGNPRTPELRSFLDAVRRGW